jgi:TolB-like protein
MPENEDNPLSFWQELKRRKVVRVIMVYSATAFVIIELVSIIKDPLRLPDWTEAMVIVLLCIGFIITVILSWVYDITPEGIEKTKPDHRVENLNVPISSKGWKIASFISFFVIAALIVLNIIPRTNLSEKRAILEKSIAVIPFIDDSPNKDNEHIFNGLMEELIIKLQSIKDLKVPGRTSVEQYRNNLKAIPEIVKELGVNYIVEGSGQKYGNQFIIRVQLLEGATGMHLWGESIEQEIVSVEDITGIQSRLANSIAGELEAIITPEEKQLIEIIPTTSLTAYELYQKGQEEYWKYYSNRTKGEALARAEERYRLALEFDPAFAKAYTGLAWIYWFRR